MRKKKSDRKLELPSSGFIFQDSERIAELFELFEKNKIDSIEFQDEMRIATKTTDWDTLKILLLYWLGPLIDWFNVRIRRRPLFPGVDV